MNKYLLLTASLLLCTTLSFATDEKTEHFIRAYDDIAFVAGVPLNERPTGKNSSIKFQFGLRTRQLCSPGGWSMFLGYRQSAVWNAFAVSGPFLDILFRPGLYFTKSIGKHDLTTGIEHLSNGRPYYGTNAAAPGYDDGSRGMNYLLFKWKYTEKGNVVAIFAKAGVGCGVGSYERHNMLFTQDLFLYYLGYLTFDYSHVWKTFGVHASITPIWNSSIANIAVDSHWNFHPKWPGIFLEYRYGYDEALCVCRPDAKPFSSLRLGLKYSFDR